MHQAEPDSQRIGRRLLEPKPELKLELLELEPELLELELELEPELLELELELEPELEPELELVPLASPQRPR